LIFAVQQLYRHQHFVSRARIREQHDRFQVGPHGHTASVEVDDLGDRPIGLNPQAEGDLRTGEIVAVEVFGYFDRGSDPYGLRRQGRRSGCGLPVRIVHRGRLPVLEIACVIAPIGLGQGG
jgi:hypothetical protein